MKGPLNTAYMVLHVLVCLALALERYALAAALASSMLYIFVCAICEAIREPKP